MDRILKICFCLLLIGIYWIPIAEFQCVVEDYSFKCQVCAHDKNCPRCDTTIPNLECRHDHRCRCKKGYGRKGGDCVQASLIVEHGERCYVNNNTLCNDDDFMSCQQVNDGRCVCPRGFDRDAVLKQCVPRYGFIFDVCRAEPEPDTCDKNAQLKCDKSTNRCLVKKGWKYDCTTKLYDKGQREHGETCNEESCMTVQPGCNPCNPDKYLECQNRECVCIEGYYWDENEGKCLILIYREYNESCKSIKCNPESSLECNDDSICDCNEGLFEYDEDEKRCVICEEEKDEGATLEGVLIAILVAVYIGVVGEVGLIVWLVRRHRRVHPGEQAQQGASSPKESKKGLKDTKSKKRATQIKKRKEGKRKKDYKIKIEP